MTTKLFQETTFSPNKTATSQLQAMEICQTDYPIDWYQQEFLPYAEEYQNLPDRDFATVVAWMEPYVSAAQKHFGDSLMLAAHYYMGGEIVRMTEFFGGYIGDSYQLSLIAMQQPHKKVIVESAVHFMAESISLLAADDQQVYITNPKSGCTMEVLAKDFMVQPAFSALNARYGAENIVPICYMNTSGRVKAMTGAQNGAVCTSSNVKKIFEWALKQNKKILFIPDRHMGENIAYWLGIPFNKIAYWPGGFQSQTFNLDTQSPELQKNFDEAQLILFSSHCGVHSYYEPVMVDYWKNKGFHVLVHPECRNDVVIEADGAGSTAFLWDYVIHDKAGTKKYAIGTENHMVKNLKEFCSKKQIEVVNLSDIPDLISKQKGCGCATMSRNDPPHLVALLDLLRKGKVPEYNRVLPGDKVEEMTGLRTRLNSEGQLWVRENAKKALQKMIEITETT